MTLSKLLFPVTLCGLVTTATALLFGLSPAVENVFRLTHVNQIFQIFNTEEEAVTPA